MSKKIIVGKNKKEPEKLPFPQFDVEEVKKLLMHRRSRFPREFSGEPVSKHEVSLLLKYAHWAPTHGRTEPWHFVVISGDARASFGEAHAALYKRETPQEEFSELKYEKLKKRPTECAHMIAICMKRGDNPKIPVIEEVCAVACAVQNIYLMATAQGLAGYWSTGGMTFHEGMKGLLALRPEDQCLGFFMLGRPKDTRHWPKGYRKTGWEEKVMWME
jgi:nitroreductase